MRRTRWDQKPLEDSSRAPNWNLEWGMPSDSTQSTSDNRHFPSPSAPLDYSHENRIRAQNFNINGVDKVNHKNASVPSSRSGDNTHLPNSWQYMGNNQLYHGLNQDPHLSYPSHSTWNQLPQNLYSNDDNQHIFDVKWWGEQRETVNPYSDYHDSYHKKDRPKNLSHGVNNWSFRMRVPKDLDRYSTSRNGKQLSTIYAHEPSAMNSKIKYDRYRNDGRQRPFSVAHVSKESSSNWKSDNLSFQGNSRFNDNYNSSQNWSHNFGKITQYNLSKNRKGGKKNNGVPSKGKVKKTNKAKSLGSQLSSRFISLKNRKPNSAAENAKQKALAVAADKLKKTFLAAKKKTIKKHNKEEGANSKGVPSVGESSAQDLTIPKGILRPRDGNSLEYDIDIRFSAQEWEFVGRGESDGAHNILDLPTAKNKGSPNIEEIDSDSDSVQTIEDPELIDTSDIEETDSSSDVEDINWNPVQSSPFVRRRHASETCLTEAKNEANKLNDSISQAKCKKTRTRSYSTSQMDVAKSQDHPRKNQLQITSNLRNILVKELLTMDKKSLHELVNYPKSRKATLMMGHLMTMHRAAISQKLNQLRFKAFPSSSSTEDDLLFWQSITPAQLESLPTDVLEQVKQILALEQSGKEHQMWEEVSVSLSDIANGFKPAENNMEARQGNNARKNYFGSQQVTHREALSDPECQIVTPPPKRPATTITIPDSDSEHFLDCLPSEADFSTSKEMTSSTPTRTTSNNCNESSASVSEPNTSEFLSPSRHGASNTLSEILPKTLNNFEASECLFLPPTPHNQSKMSVASAKLKSRPSPIPRLGNTALITGNSHRLGEEPQNDRPGSCVLNLHAPSINVKQERPSPMSECGFCLHPPRSPHTPNCGFPFGIPASPVALMPGPPRPLGHSHQRPVPHLPGQLNLFKHEKQASFVSLDVNRPSSEERPKNPAPPETTSNEPPSPLPIIPPSETPLHQHPTLHQPPPPIPPRPLIFSPQSNFSEPPRPPSPPPPHSPRIKFERQTPQFVCCCMRNECERSSSGHQSADFLRDSRRNSATPQNQLCETAQRLTPQLYKMEHHFLSNRARTPHHNLMNMFHLAPSPRSISSGNHLQELNSQGSTMTESSKVNTGVQTEKLVHHESKEPCSQRASVTRPVSPMHGKSDQATSTLSEIDDQPSSVLDEVPSAQEEPCREQNEEQEVNDVIHGIKLFSWEGSELSEKFMRLESHEMNLINHIERAERKMQELLEQKMNMLKTLKVIHSLRSDKMKHLLNENEGISRASASKNPCLDKSIITDTLASTLDPCVDTWKEKQEMSSYCLPENLSIVSSSQEIVNETSTDESTNINESSNEGYNITKRQRCTSSSLFENNESHEKEETLYKVNNVRFFSNAESDTDFENHVSQCYFPKKKNAKHYNKKFELLSRNRTGSISTSDDDTLKVKTEPSSGIELDDSFNKRCDVEDFIENPTNVKCDENRLNSLELSISHEDNCITEDEEASRNASISNRKPSLSSSPLSPKTRNSSGSEHGYSLRSRGPPSESFEGESSQLVPKELGASMQDDSLEINGEKQLSPPVDDANKTHLDENQADDELEKEDYYLDSSRNSSDVKIISEEKGKRKRKSKKYGGNKKKRKKDLELAPASLNLPDLDLNFFKNRAEGCELTDFLFINPPQHKESVLELKVIGKYILSASSDGTARLYDPCRGIILATYSDHTDSVTSIQVVRRTSSNGGASFQVVTGSEDRAVRVYNGNSGTLIMKRVAGEPIRCLEYRWELLFIGTDGGSGIKWNLKDKKLGERVQYCGKGITCLLSHVEGGRKVLVVCAKTTPIMVRDAMSGLFLRTLEYVQLTVYSAIFEGSLFFTGGADKNICIYDFCTGSLKERIDAQSAISRLTLHKNFLLATCYDGFIRIFKLPEAQLVHVLPVEATDRMFCCSALYKNKMLLGNKGGDVVSCTLPDLDGESQ